jgi:hypothetical protein
MGEFDSKPFRLATRLMIVDEAFGMFARTHDHLRPFGLDLEGELQDLRARNASLIGRAAELAAKAAPVFSDAHDRAAHPAAYADRRVQFFNLSADMQRAVSADLKVNHAFDQGDEKLLARVQALRDSIARRVTQGLREEGYLLGEQPSPRLQTVISANVAEAQASDIAAGVAAIIYERHGLQGLVKRWEYVVFNGSRVTENSVDEHLRRWRALTG